MPTANVAKLNPQQIKIFIQYHTFHDIVTSLLPYLPTYQNVGQNKKIRLIK